MKTFLTAIFWIPLFLICLGVFIHSIFGLLPIFAVSLISPSLAIGLLVGVTVAARRH